MNNFRLALFLFWIAIVSTSCHVADIRHAQASLRNGDITLATTELTTLAESGVPEAQILLGDISIEKDPSLAESYFLTAEKQGEFRATGRLAKFYALRADNYNEDDAQKSLIYIRKALSMGDDSVLTNLVGITQGFPSLKLESETENHINHFKKTGSSSAQYSEILWWELKGNDESNLEQIETTCLRLLELEPGCYRSLVNVYQIKAQPEQENKIIDAAISNYKKNTITPLSMLSFAQWLAHPDRRVQLVDKSLQILDMIIADLPSAEFEIAKILYVNPNLQQSKRLMAILQKEEEKGNWRATELEAEIFFYGQNKNPNPRKALPLLLSIENHSAAANYMIGMINRDGLIDEPNANKALKRLLIAARFGYSRADTALAQMFSQGKVITPDLIYAYSFAQLSQTNGSTSIQNLINEMNLSMSSSDKELSQKIYNEELHARSQLKHNHTDCCLALLQPAQ